MSTLIQTDLPRPARQTRPTMYDLPYNDLKDDDMADEFHSHQALLLFETFQPATVPLDQVFSAIDMNLYYDEDHPLHGSNLAAAPRRRSYRTQGLICQSRKAR